MEHRHRTPRDLSARDSETFRYPSGAHGRALRPPPAGFPRRGPSAPVELPTPGVLTSDTLPYQRAHSLHQGTSGTDPRSCFGVGLKELGTQFQRIVLSSACGLAFCSGCLGELPSLPLSARPAERPGATSTTATTTSTSAITTRMMTATTATIKITTTIVNNNEIISSNDNSAQVRGEGYSRRTRCLLPRGGTPSARYQPRVSGNYHSPPPLRWRAPIGPLVE